jgi:MFS family permease
LGQGRLWSRNFLLLGQGQLVSAAGDAVYRIAIGFWILAATGSTALMGALLAASVVPRILLSPIGGAYADRVDRRWLLVGSDLGAGLAVLLLGLAALAGTIEVWMAFAVAVLLGAASAVFDPTVDAAVADVVPKKRLGQANAAFALVGAGAAIAGNALGGFLYQALGAALLFLANGASFIASAASELFLRMPAPKPSGAKPPVRRELRAGVEVVRRRPGLGTLFAATSAAHVGTTAVFVLLVPLFERAPHLGAGAYGLALGAMSAGALIGFLIVSALPVRASRRLLVWLVAGAVAAGGFAAVPWLGTVGAMVPFMVAAGVGLSVQDTVLTTALQLAVAPDMRGKLFGLRATAVLSLGALSMLGAGALAEALPLAHLITAAAAIALLSTIATSLSPAARGLFAQHGSSPTTPADRDSGRPRRG